MSAAFINFPVPPAAPLSSTCLSGAVAWRGLFLATQPQQGLPAAVVSLETAATAFETRQSVGYISLHLLSVCTAWCGGEKRPRHQGPHAFDQSAKWHGMAVSRLFAAGLSGSMLLRVVVYHNSLACVLVWCSYDTYSSLAGLGVCKGKYQRRLPVSYRLGWRQAIICWLLAGSYRISVRTATVSSYPYISSYLFLFRFFFIKLFVQRDFVLAPALTRMYPLSTAINSSTTGTTIVHARVALLPVSMLLHPSRI